MDGSCLGAAIRGADADENVFRGDLGIFHDDIEITALIKDAGIYELIFQIVLAAPAIFFQQLLVGICGVRIFVEILHVGVRRSVVQVEVILFHVFAMIAFMDCETEHAFFENGIVSIPESDGKAEILVTIANAGDAIFIPTVGTRAGVIVREIAPGVATLAVILANSAPSALRQERSPTIPVAFALLIHVQANTFASVVDGHGGLSN